MRYEQEEKPTHPTPLPQMNPLSTFIPIAAGTSPCKRGTDLNRGARFRTLLMPGNVVASGFCAALPLHLLLLFCVLCSTAIAQPDSTRRSKPTLNITGFLDFYYAYDFNQPKEPKRQAFLSSYNRHNQINLNLGCIKLDLEHARYRAKLAVQTGTYPQDNYAAEAGAWKNILEANIGFSLNHKHNLWLEAGVLPSYIGFETALAPDNWTLTRSILAENTPYFVTGAKLTYDPNERWEFAALALNGWQRIQSLKGNSLPSFGTQITYKPNAKVALNWSTFTGTDDPDARRRMRYFHNLYGQFEAGKRFRMLVGVDIGFQQKEKKSSAYTYWVTPIVLGQFTLSEQWKTAVRLEYYADPSGTIIHTHTPNGFQTAGASLNLDYTPTENLLCRIEGRWLKSRDALFERGNALVQNNYLIAASVAVKLSNTLNR